MMSSEFDITLDDDKYNVCVDRLDEGGLLVVKVGEESYTIKATQNDDGSWILNDTTNDYSIKILKKTSSMLSVEIDDQPREIAWQRIMKKQSTSTPQTASTGDPKVAGSVYPPMPGKITEVHVKVGDTVKNGQTVCILEAMKMFNELKASANGTIKEVNVETGSNVTTADLLILIE
ncbi:MAG: biotin/lipoyl-binding protein [Candidatus Thorarchaeota archaeon]|nr:biotin/lipoyl-binding protein [Candidatus Thorarchaeota archaeon]